MNELEWLTDHRPDVAEPDEGTTAYARTALLAYAVRTGEEGPSRDRVTAGAGTARGATHRDTATPRGARRAPRAAQGAALRARRRGLRDRHRRRRERAALGRRARAQARRARHGRGGARQALAIGSRPSPTPTGDATLVIRHQAYPDGKDIPGADLYLDDGRYYYAPTLAGLQGRRLRPHRYRLHEAS